MTVSVPGIVDLVEIGRGGFGVVLRGRQVALDRVVAVKVLATADVDRTALARFELEAQILGRLSEHPNIVTVHDFGRTADGRPYVAMAYLPAGSLADRLRDHGPLPPQDVARIGIELAGALASAHALGVLHRDIKPANVLTTSFGQAALADFGIARMVGRTMTVAGAFSASLTHAAPEMLDGSDPTARSDVYSLASTLFALLAGRAAFEPGPDGAVAQLVGSVLRQPVGDLRPLGVPDGLATAIEAGMAKDPANRPDGALGLASLLADAQRASGWALTRPVLLELPDDPPAPDDRQPGAALTTEDDVTRQHARSGPPARPAEHAVAPVRPPPPPPPVPPPPSVTVERLASSLKARRRRRWQPVLVTLLLMWLIGGAAQGGNPQAANGLTLILLGYLAVLGVRAVRRRRGRRGAG